ncbi:RimJ/RimL family protein N-acetyltransferase [Luteimonas cucumeris]|uniref:RimJ/RimL family protein N-acetyltransferase n=1 Tax=Luteimonas cucumeris TaxID=985012 RepID=A0A562LF71_9GAMM|nr:GNAT family protein [Luteimonas cucumeris]TWI06257.1 RimJ/RimL family protein N-acetyltransferase [Luteimonas cucumeris]
MNRVDAIDIGGGLRLRTWRQEDLHALLRHADDEQVARGLSERFPSPYTRADGEAFLAGDVVDFSDPVFAIEIAGEACGGIGARPGQNERGHSAELGYWLGRAFWRRGHMTRVVAAFVPWLMRELHLHRLQAGVLDFNTASARVLSKNGFATEGVQRQAIRKRDRYHDLHLFARLRSE